LKVLEDRNKGKPDSENELVDARGFADGVKVARKNSKAVCLAKAVEYIRVLKRREDRLKREQDGLKSLMRGLVGGPALLKEWEAAWTAQFGGEERDEVEGEDLDADSDGDDDEDEDGEDRPMKKLKVSVPKPQKVAAPEPPKVTPPTPVLAPGQASQVTEKRKRGRPRKHPLPDAPAPQVEQHMSAGFDPSMFVVTDAPVMPPSQQQPQQYLLAAFALFSFFNSPLTSTSFTRSHAHAHTHTGSVVSHPPMPSASATTPGTSPGWRDLLQAVHLLITILLFVSIVAPWLPRRWKAVNRLLRPLSSVTPMAPQHHTEEEEQDADETEEEEESTEDEEEDTASHLAPQVRTIKHALSDKFRGHPKEVEELREALNVPSGVIGLVHGAFTGGKVSSGSFEEKQFEQRAWVRLAELAAMRRKYLFSRTRNLIV
jgi:hypothetical protein